MESFVDRQGINFSGGRGGGGRGGGCGGCGGVLRVIITPFMRHTSCADDLAPVTNIYDSSTPNFSFSGRVCVCVFLGCALGAPSGVAAAAAASVGLLARLLE